MDPTSVISLLLFAEGKVPAGPSLWTTLMPFAIIAVLFYFLLLRPQQNERARRQAMLDAMKKNDRVLVAGGIYGVVAEVDREANRVTVKVDETSNTKLRVTLNSVLPLGQEAPPVEKGKTD